MKKCLTLLICFMSICFAICSCTNKEKTFRKELNAALVDKVVTDAEYEIVMREFKVALMKSKGAGLVIHPNFIVTSEEELVDFLISEKGITGDASAIVEKCRKVEFRRMHIMLENSVSMQGYPGKGNPNFSDPVVSLFHCGAEEYLTYYVGAKSTANATVKFEAVDSQSFLREISHGKIRINTSSPIDQIIAESIDTHLERGADGTCSDVFCLITDGIVSGTNAEIVANKDFTYNNLPVIENRVRAAFEKAYDRGLHCLLYRLETPFDGTYFDYQNGRHSYKGNRPYFMIFVGEKDNLVKVEDGLKDEDYAYTHRLATYDSENAQVIKKGAVRRIPGKSNFSLKGNVLEYKYNPMAKQPVEFNLEINLSTLPVYCFDAQYLRENFVLTYQDNATSVEIAIPNDEWLSDDIILNNDNKLCTIPVCISSDYLTSMKAASSVALTLPLSQDEWYKRYSTLDDLHIDQDDPTTFGLERLIGGVLKGFKYGKQSDQNLIEYKLTMKKD